MPSGRDGDAGLGKSGLSLPSPTRCLTTACTRRPVTVPLMFVAQGRG
jgi:hypothetical protein